MLTNWDPSWPERFGVTGIAYTQEQDDVVGNAEIMLGQLSIPEEAIGEIENEVTQFGVKADFWILPFWNVHGMIGDVDGKTEVTPALPGFAPINVDYDGTVYGAGTTLAYGQDWWFASATGIYTYTDLEGDMEGITAWLVISKLGVRYKKLQAWVGATYQSVRENQSGVFDVAGVGTAIYDIELEGKEEWNAQVGARYEVFDSVYVTLEAGFGNRQSLLGHLEWRFW